jgi:hypothetical protein
VKLLLLCCGAIALAEDVSAPRLTTEQKLDYRRAQVNLLTAQRAFDDVVQGLRKDCGAGGLVLDQVGDPACLPSPAAPAADPKPH